MNTIASLDKCATFIDSQMRASAGRGGTAMATGPKSVVTISRQSGSGAHAVAEKLLEYLQSLDGEQKRPWAVFDRNLVEQVLEDHHLPKRLAQFMPEDRISEISDTMDELFGLHPPSWTLVRQATETILRLVELGNVIVIGRGAHVITRNLDYVFHVRLVGSVEKRAEYLEKFSNISHRAALELMNREDRGRERYLRKYFDTDINDPLLYHLIINTDLVSYDHAARLIACAVLNSHEPTAPHP